VARKAQSLESIEARSSPEIIEGQLHPAEAPS
jgi:hypothetical protein